MDLDALISRFYSNGSKPHYIHAEGIDRAIGNESMLLSNFGFSRWFFLLLYVLYDPPIEVILSRPLYLPFLSSGTSEWCSLP
ncbi:hypothetical protein M408DRAFT_155071 [Serendipita vermifera MAFF 305830]|uniref:Uncharacterized protein n=1 Tax=Serendipita vermifera MAFF 305830 TaxID=933852 RepID=A0A0C3BPU5_SERVB|nr:hypothetical protein M408DRAFT_155071 [Serendipita vermifera MAFF 305830]